MFYQTPMHGDIKRAMFEAADSALYDIREQADNRTVRIAEGFRRDMDIYQRETHHFYGLHGRILGIALGLMDAGKE